MQRGLDLLYIRFNAQSSNAGRFVDRSHDQGCNFIYYALTNVHKFSDALNLVILAFLIFFR